MSENNTSQPITNINPFQNILGEKNINLVSSNFLPIVNCIEDIKGSQDSQNGVLLELISTAVLCREYKGVQFPGQAFTVLFLDADHKFKVESLAEELQKKVRLVAEAHFRSLDKKDRKTLRITSKEQWQIVKKSLARLQILQLFSHQALEIALCGLHRLLRNNNSITLIVINSINTFYQEVSYETCIYASAYLRKLLVHLLHSCSLITDRQLYCAYTQQGQHNREDRFYDQIKAQDKLEVFKDPIFIRQDADISETNRSHVLHFKTVKLRKSY